MAIAPRQFLLDRFEGFNRLTNGQKFGLMLGLAALFSLLVGSWIWFRAPDYKVLYSNLNDRDGGTIVATLQQQNIPYKMAEGGGAILVPADMVYETRLKLASQGLPRGGSVGFELLENQKLGVSQFQEQVNFQRALEGELGRTIQSLASVQSARVHLAIPRPTVFIREQEKPSASVLLTLYPGRVLDPAQVSGIMHLVSSSVPQLSYKDVTVVDQNGNMLNRTDSEYGRMGLEPAQLEYTRQVEQSYIKRIESILTPLAGPGNVHAQVAAEVDFSQTEQTAETFKPNPTPAEAA
ncbi:MAG: flagellar basal-body MS-ring/collar protein FliF, partial [Sulfuricellaceae bacterium]